MEKRINAIIIDKLGCEEEEVTPEANIFNDLGCDSLDSIELIMEFEKEWDISISDSDADKVETIQNIYDLVKEYIKNK